MNQIKNFNSLPSNLTLLPKNKIQESSLRQNIQKKLQTWKAKGSPYEQRLLTARQTLKKRTNKVQNMMDVEHRAQSKIEVLHKFYPKSQLRPKSTSRNIMQSNDFNLFKEQASSRRYYKSTELQKNTFVRSKSALNVPQRQLSIPQPSQKRPQEETEAQTSRKSHQLLFKKMSNPKSNTKQEPSSYKKIRQIFIFQQGIVMKNQI